MKITEFEHSQSSHVRDHVNLLDRVDERTELKLTPNGLRIFHFKSCYVLLRILIA